MNEFEAVGWQLKSLLQGLLGSEPYAPRAFTEGETTSRSAAEFMEALEAKARTRRKDPSRVAGSRHFAFVLAYGNFILADGTNIRCEAIPGISGVDTLPEVKTMSEGQPQVLLRRILTHFHFLQEPEVLIEQHPSKPSVGTLTGASNGKAGSLLPGKATFSQHLILTLNGQPLANREPLVMTAERVEEWPPVGSSFVSEAPTDFYLLAEVDNPDAKPLAALSACNAVTVAELSLPVR